MPQEPKTTGLIFPRGADEGVEILSGNPWFGDKISLGFIPWSSKADIALADMARANTGDIDARLRLETLSQ